ncbi:MAG: hypothetical protein AAGC81_04615 [Pseudomonadota bacterium]
MTGIYHGYGLNFASDLALSGFAETSSQPDVTIRISAEARETAEAVAADPISFTKHPEQGYLLRVEAGDYWIQNARSVLITPAPETDEAYVRLYVTGTVIGLILHLRGIQTLHAATIAIEGTAIAFVGEQGAGKSTLAAAMAAKHPILGDDVVAVEPCDDGVLALPGGAEFKLWQETLDHLGLPQGPRIANRTEKFYVPAPGNHLTKSVPLGAVIVLERGGSTIGVERYPLLEATDQLVQHAYRPELVPILGRQADHFRQAAQLAARLPVWRLRRPEGLVHLKETCAWLEAHWPELTTSYD